MEMVIQKLIELIVDQKLQAPEACPLSSISSSVKSVIENPCVHTVARSVIPDY
jgi:hypothetical protein